MVKPASHKRFEASLRYQSFKLTWLLWDYDPAYKGVAGGADMLLGLDVVPNLVLSKPFKHNFSNSVLFYVVPDPDQNTYA